MKKYLFIPLALGVMCLASCGGSKQVGNKGDVEINVPCSGSEYQSDKNHFRASSSALSSDMNAAKTKALANARAEIATQMNALVERTTDNYLSSYQVGEDEEFKGKFNDLSRIVVKENLSGSRVICEKLMKTKDGKYRSYITVEVSVTAVLDRMKSKISADDKLRTDFEYEKYKKTFDEEMSKLDK